MHDWFWFTDDLTFVVDKFEEERICRIVRLQNRHIDSNTTLAKQTGLYLFVKKTCLTKFLTCFNEDLFCDICRTKVENISQTSKEHDLKNLIDTNSKQTNLSSRCLYRN